MVFTLTLNSCAISGSGRSSSSRIRRTSDFCVGDRAGGPATDATPLARCFQPLLRPLGNPLPFELGDGRKDMEHQPTGWRCGVNVLGQRPETRALHLDRVQNVEKITQGPRKAVILGDSDHVALAQMIEQAVQLGPAARCAGDLVSEDPLGTRRLQSVELAVQVLVICADAGVSDDHVALCQKPPKTAKVLSQGFVRAKCLISCGAGQRDTNDRF